MEDTILLDDRNLVAEFLLDGNANDTSGNGYNGTASNVVYNRTDMGYQSQCGVFNGTSSYVSTPTITSSNFSGSFTLSATGYITAASGYNAFVSYGVQDNQQIEILHIDSTGVPYCNIRSWGTNYDTYGYWTNGTTPSVLDGKPHTMVMVYDKPNSEIRFYLDGNLTQLRTGVSLTLTFPSYPSVEIGRKRANSSLFVGYLNGLIQTVRIFNAALSEKEIRNRYLHSLRMAGGSSLHGLMDGCVGWWDCRKDANDIVGGSDGTLGGSTQILGEKGFGFNATNDARVLIPNNANTSPINNLSVILYASPSTTGQFLFGWANNGIEFHTSLVGITRYVDSNIAYNATISASTNSKHCIVLTQSSSTGLKIYFDGTLVVSQPTLTNNTFDSALSTAIGGRADGASPSNAKIYDVLMFNREVTATEAKAWTGVLKQENILPFV